MEIVALLWSNVYGRRQGTRMREVWKDEEKEDEGRRREWERRWREASDIMNEEDVMETPVMHLCIPDYKKKAKDKITLPGTCSYTALRILLMEEVDRELTYHFSVHEPLYVVTIRNLPSATSDSNHVDLITSHITGNQTNGL